MNKSNKSPHTSQVPKTKKPFSLRTLLSKLSKEMIQLLFIAKSFSDQGKLCYANQTTLGNKVDRCRQTMALLANELEELDLFDIERRGKGTKMTNIYHLSEWLKTPESIKQLNLFKKYSIFGLSLLFLPSQTTLPINHLTQYKGSINSAREFCTQKPSIPVLDLSKMLLTAHEWNKKICADERYAQNNERRTWPPRKYKQTKQELDREVCEIIGDSMYDYSDPDWNESRKTTKPPAVPFSESLPTGKLLNKTPKRELSLEEHKQKVYEKARKKGIDITGLAYGEISRRLSGYSTMDQKIAPPPTPPVPLPSVSHNKAPIFKQATMEAFVDYANDNTWDEIL